MSKQPSLAYTEYFHGPWTLSPVSPNHDQHSGRCETPRSTSGDLWVREDTKKMQKRNLDGN